MLLAHKATTTVIVLIVLGVNRFPVVPKVSTRTEEDVTSVILILAGSGAVPSSWYPLYPFHPEDILLSGIRPVVPPPSREKAFVLDRRNCRLSNSPGPVGPFTYNTRPVVWLKVLIPSLKTVPV